MAKIIKEKNPKEIVHYDAKSDVLYLGAKKGLEEEYVEVAPGIGIELDDRGKVIGVEILNASRVMKPVAKRLFPTVGRISRREPSLAAR